MILINTTTVLRRNDNNIHVPGQYMTPCWTDGFSRYDKVLIFHELPLASWKNLNVTQLEFDKHKIYIMQII